VVPTTAKQVMGLEQLAAQLGDEYETALREYLSDQPTAALARARELGRTALAGGLTALDMAKLYHRALPRVLSSMLTPRGCVRAIKAAEKIFVESLTPYERNRAEEALRRLNARLEEEARRVAHALHDDAAQLLASVHLAVAEIARELPETARRRLEQIPLLLDQVADHVRHLAYELRPIVLDDLGLVAALEFLAQGVSRRTGLAVRIDGSIDATAPAIIQTAVYRIVQETLNNVCKHARATKVCVRLEQNTQTIRCSIADDGIGFDPSAVSGRHGLGLIGIRERLAALGGSLSIATGRGGTTFDLRIPLRSRAACVA
jgi:signal transduction histidine kinase